MPPSKDRDKDAALLEHSVTELKEELEQFDGDLHELLQREKQGKNRKTAKDAIKKEMKRRGEEPPTGLPTPDFGGVELPTVTAKDLFVIGAFIAALFLLPYFTYQGSTLDTTEDVVNWLENNHKDATSPWCRNFTKTFETSNTSLRRQGATCDCYPAESIPEDRIAVEQLVRDTATLRAIVVCSINGEKQVVPYWEAPRGSGVQTTP